MMQHNGSHHSQHDSQPRRVVETHDFTTGRIHVAGPVGAVVTDSGLTLAVNLVDPDAAAYRLRCLSCCWSATGHGPADLTRLAAGHARDHETHARPTQTVTSSANETHETEGAQA